MTAELVVRTLLTRTPTNKVYLRVDGPDLVIVQCLFRWRILSENGEYLVGDFGRFNPDGTFPAAAKRRLKRLNERKTQVFKTPPFRIIEGEEGEDSGWIIWAATVAPADALKHARECLGISAKILDLRTAVHVAKIARKFLHKQQRAREMVATIS